MQAAFWEAVAETCKDSPAIFCYDLMNEPILPGKEPTDRMAGRRTGRASSSSSGSPSIWKVAPESRSPRHG